jgi:hypothetical protein
MLCVCEDSPPCKIHPVCVRRISQGGALHCACVSRGTPAGSDAREALFRLRPELHQLRLHRPACHLRRRQRNGACRRQEQWWCLGGRGECLHTHTQPSLCDTYRRLYTVCSLQGGGVCVSGAEVVQVYATPPKGDSSMPKGAPLQNLIGATPSLYDTPYVYTVFSHREGCIYAHAPFCKIRHIYTHCLSYRGGGLRRVRQGGAGQGCEPDGGEPGVSTPSCVDTWTPSL